MPDVLAADLDGLLVAPELAHRLPLAVSIDDSRAARPQSGFNATSIVWQAPADGYESRYLMVFQEQDAVDIGPVRSARIYLAHWASELDAALSHYGGDRLTRRWMEANRGDLFVDVDGMGAGNSAYHRISARKAPHNAYTSSADLRATATRLGAPVDLPVELRRAPFIDPDPAAAAGRRQTLEVPYRTNLVGYAFEPATDRYLRSIDGRAQVDPADGGRVAATNVVVLFMPYRIDTKIEPGHARPVIDLVGTGRALVLREGVSVEATWSKADLASPTILLGPDGAELTLVRGTTFVQVVAVGTKLEVRN